MNEYQEMAARHQEEANALPLHWAFDKKQFAEEMGKLGLDPEKDMDKITAGPGGSFVRVEDFDVVIATFKRHKEEETAAIAADLTGDGFIYQMFLDELYNTEYGYTGDPSEAIYHLGLMKKQVEEDPRLKHGLEKAMNKIDGRQDGNENESSDENNF